jgi:hypothetical protein
VESMTSVQRAGRVDDPATLDEPAVADPALEVYCWRMERLLEAGYTLLVADALAQDTAVDVRKAVELLAARSPYEATVRALARWTQLAGDRLSRYAPVDQTARRRRLERASVGTRARAASGRGGMTTATARSSRPELARLR